jgi:hypothetical protein
MRPTAVRCKGLCATATNFFKRCLQLRSVASAPEQPAFFLLLFLMRLLDQFAGLDALLTLAPQQSL